ncbi:rho GTPase-activating protein gacF-like [Rhagoletis pomonella]|uniref:rho GTPase-activating protein gacF-like n=1 Tax=Rhagoletis pomonella TaxID=28610 RepID=UPI00177BE075|nr:rho GTPase-activating protein gacF-like [Rhagoletis pomonella]
MASSVGSSSSTSNECSYKNCHLNISASTTSASAVAGTQQRRSQHRTTLPIQATHVAHDMLQQFVTVADVEISGATVGYHSLPSGSGSIGGSSNDMELLTATTMPTSSQYAGSHMAGAISTPSIDVLPLMSGEIATISSNTSDSITQTTFSPVAGAHTLPTNAHTQTLKSGSSSANSPGSQSSKTPSSSRRYHRTIPRYFALTDPLSAKEAYGVGKSKSDNSTRNNAGTTSSASKKPTCQCPVQHVPMSYMAATQLSNAAQCASSSALLSALSSKLNAVSQSSAASQTSSASSTLVSSHGNSSSGRSNTSTSLGYSQRAKSSNSLQQTSASEVNSLGGTLKRAMHTTSTNTNTSNNASNKNNNTNNNASSLCSYETKIATISKQVGDSTAANLSGSTVGGHHHHTAHHAHHAHHSHSVVVLPTQAQDESMPIVLGRVQKRSSGERERERDRERERERERERARSASSGRGSSNSSTHQLESSAAAFYLNGKVDAYLNFPQPQHFNTIHSQQQPHHQHHQQQQTNDTNPILPPKLHKSLTNLKSSTSNNHSIMTTTTKPSNVCAAVAATTPTTTATATVSSSCTAVQTISSLSKPTTSTAAYSSRKDHHNNLDPISSIGINTSSSNKNSPPSLTLPLSPVITKSAGGTATHSSSGTGGVTPSNTVGSVSHSSEKSSKINSSTFYPLQNSHVTYTLPKHISGKVSLNSTITSVVSKVPSVISIPIGGGEVDLYENNNGCGGSNALSQNSGTSSKHETSSKNGGGSGRSTTLPKILRTKKQQGCSGSNTNSNNMNNQPSPSNSTPSTLAAVSVSVSQCSMPAYPQQYTSHHAKTNTNAITTTTTANATTQFNSHVVDGNTLSSAKHLPVCTTSKNCLNPKEHFLPNDTSLDDDYLSECENCKIAQSAKYYLNAEEVESTPQETMTLQRKSMDDNKEEQEQAYYRISHTLPTNPKKNA